MNAFKSGIADIHKIVKVCIEFFCSSVAAANKQERMEIWAKENLSKGGKHG